MLFFIFELFDRIESSQISFEKDMGLEQFDCVVLVSFIIIKNIAFVNPFLKNLNDQFLFISLFKNRLGVANRFIYHTIICFKISVQGVDEKIDRSQEPN